jgi:hypothetical protein
MEKVKGSYYYTRVSADAVHRNESDMRASVQESRTPPFNLIQWDKYAFQRSLKRNNTHWKRVARNFITLPILDHNLHLREKKGKVNNI